MGKIAQHIRTAILELKARLGNWVRSPFRTLYRWSIPTVLYGGVCLAMPVWLGLPLFAPIAIALAAKAAFIVKGIRALDYVRVTQHVDKATQKDEQRERPSLDVKADRLQRAWVLACAFILVVILAALGGRIALALFPSPAIPEGVTLYGGFMAVLLGGFLTFYGLALRYDKTILRGLASIVVTLPAFFLLVMAGSVLLSWASSTIAAVGISPEGMLEYGRVWLYWIQHVLGVATGYFLEQDTTIIVISVVFAAVLLLAYTLTIPQYWMKSVSRWLRGISAVAAVLGTAVIVFAGVWLTNLQQFAIENLSDQLAGAVDTSVIDSQTASLSHYESSDFIALIRAFVLPYIVGVFVANAVLALRRGQARTRANAILDGLAANGTVDEEELPALRKRYLYYDGSQTLWDLVMRSIGRDVPLPHPFAPRPLTIQERLTGVLADPAPEVPKEAQ